MTPFALSTISYFLLLLVRVLIAWRVASEAVLEPGGLDPEIADWNLEGPYSAFLGKTTTGTCLDFTFCRSEAGHYRDPMLYFTLQEVSDRLRGCWGGCYDPCARLRCFPRLEKQDFDCSLYFTVLLQ
ncbi:hypothetical protein F2Q69_00006033 [Brassica cretica]|uniref:Secreted protein n=1 Tax=Brassica cretica TaxID=69181 RepID=A0A8S9P1P2_BRACR|nr:hypothetical protein F2Q69_00006033 [Brassica cretica]